MKAKIRYTNPEMLRFFKLLAVVLMEKKGFKHDRILEIWSSISELAIDREKDECFWEHVDDIVINKLRIDVSKENYDVVNNPKLFAGVPKQKPLSIAELHTVLPGMKALDLYKKDLGV